MGKRAINILLLLIVLSGKISAQGLDSLQYQRFITRATSYGIGYTNVYDTYLSPQEYKGVEFRVARESMRMTKLFDGNVSTQSFFQAYVSYAENKTETNNAFAGLVNWNYGLHYQFRINENLKLLAGGLADMNLGFVYNLRNSNNPASAKAYVNLAASGMIIYNFRIKRYPMTLRYQANLPVMGVMFSPDGQQSYLEIFTYGNRDNIIKFTSLYNQPAVRQMLSLDFPVRYSKLRFSYLCDIQQTDVNGLQTHTYSHIFMIGLVKSLYSIRSKSPKSMPAY